MEIVFSFFAEKIDFDISCKLSPQGIDNLHEISQPNFSQNKKEEEHIINLSFAEFAKRVANFNVYFVQRIIHTLATNGLIRAQLFKASLA